MYAVLCQQPGGPEILHWGECPRPEPKPGEVLIKVAAAGVNRADILQRLGKYPPPQDASDILGMEVSGEVVLCGRNISRWKAGDKVCALLGGGGYAEYVAAPEGQCLPWPAAFSAVEAGGITECALTVWINLFEAAAFKPHEAVLVHGGASGIGTTAIQMVKAFGAKIFVTVGSADKQAACRKLGANLAIDYKTEDFVEAVKKATNGHGVDVVVDIVGKDYVLKNLKALAPHGRHVSVGTLHGKDAMIDLREIMSKQLIMTGSTMRARDPVEKARVVAAGEANVWPWVAAGKVKPLIYKAFPMKNAAEAHKLMESGAHIGKIVLEV